MRFRSGMTFTLAAVLLLGGCAAAASGGGGPETSPTGKVYPPGTPPSQSEFTRTAILASAQGNYASALEQAQLGIAADSTNPQHFFLAGEAAAGLGNFELADSMWREAERIYPAYELEIEPARESAWATAFNAGVEAYNAGDAAGAIQAWSDAALIYPYHPNAGQNLGIVLTQETRYDEAIEAYRQGLAAAEMLPQTRVLEEAEIAEREEAKAFLQKSLAELLVYTDQFAEAEALLREQLEVNPDDVELRANLANAVARQGREAEAATMYGELLNSPGLDDAQLFSIGVSLFNANEYERASEAFERVTQSQPNNRDAWYNHLNALFAAENWNEVIPVGQRLLELDPLNANASLFVVNAHRELDQGDQALAVLQRVETLPVFVDGLQIRLDDTSTVVQGQVEGNAAAAGSPVRLRFTFYGEAGELGNQTVSVNAPAAQQTAPFEITFPQQASYYRYEVAP